MLISHRKQFIYTKTNKTGGTSVESYFEKYCMPEGEWAFAHHRGQHVSKAGIVGARGPGASRSEWFNHMSAALIMDKLGALTWDRYFKFCVVRNPFDKLVSWFFFQRHKNTLDEPDSDDITSFRKQMSRGIPVLDRGCYVIDGALCLDEIIRFEDLSPGVHGVCRRLDVPFVPGNIPRLKSGIRPTSIPVREFYSPEIVERVEQAYEFEIETFGYRLEDIPY